MYVNTGKALGVHGLGGPKDIYLVQSFGGRTRGKVEIKISILEAGAWLSGRALA